MKWLTFLTLLREILAIIERIYDKIRAQKVIKKLKEAKDKAFASGDQRPIEKSLGGSSKSTKYKYDKLRSQKRK